MGQREKRDWKARGGPRGLYSLPLPLIRLEPAPRAQRLSQRRDCLESHGTDLPGGGLALLARERMPSGVPHTRPRSPAGPR